MHSFSFTLLVLVAMALFCVSPAAAQQAPTTSTPKGPIVILKLDDISTSITPRWQRVHDFLKERKIKAGFGIITASLENPKPQTIAWIKQVHAEGLIEFWHHGYTLRGPNDKGEFEHGTAEEQAALLQKGEALAKEKLGFELAAFGPHWSGTTEETEKAVEMTPEIKIWLYGPKGPKHFTRLSIPRVLSLENPTFLPNAEKFRELYEKNKAGQQEVLVLQGHPNNWEPPERWEGFVKIIDFLQQQNCTFMTPSEYLRHHQAKKSAAQ